VVPVYVLKEVSAGEFIHRCIVMYGDVGDSPSWFEGTPRIVVLSEVGELLGY
jgi:hypothetical protein